MVRVSLPANAERLVASSVPREVTQALAKLVAGGGIGQGKTEVLVWTKNYKKSNAPNLLKQLTANLQAAGWEYEVGGEIKA